MLKLGAPGIRGRNTFYMGPSSKKAFDIASLFENGEQGIWLDPNDLSTMYQDAAGTVPVTAAVQSVGLMLDKSKGLRLGVNLVPQESFAEGTTGWLLQSGWTFTGDKVICDGSTSLVLRDTKFVLGKRYRITIVATRTSASGVLSIRNGSSSATVIAVTEATGIEVIERTVHVTDSTQPHIFFLSQVGWEGEISSIRIEEILGNHAYQTTSASRPILRKNAVTGANYLEFDGIDDFLTIDLPEIVTDSVFFAAKVRRLRLDKIYEYIFSNSATTEAGRFSARLISAPNLETAAAGVSIDVATNQYTSIISSVKSSELSVVVGVSRPDKISLYTDNTISERAPSNTVLPTKILSPIVIGKASPTSNSWAANMRISELIVVFDAVSDDEITKIVEYLRA